LIMSTGGKSRWANIFLGIFVIIFIIFFGDLVELVAMPTVAAILFVVGFQIIQPAKIRDVWDVNKSKRLIMVTTFALTLALPVQQAIIIGVFFSFMDYIYNSSKVEHLSELQTTETGAFRVAPAPTELASNHVTLLHSRGSTYFAAARTLQEQLPTPKTAQNAVVIIRLRGNEEIGSTFILVLERYASELHANGGRLILSGVHQDVLDQLKRTGTTDMVPEEAIFMETNILGESTKAALAEAEAWLAKKDAVSATEEEE